MESLYSSTEFPGCSVIEFKFSDEFSQRPIILATFTRFHLFPTHSAGTTLLIKVRALRGTGTPEFSTLDKYEAEGHQDEKKSDKSNENVKNRITVILVIKLAFNKLLLSHR